MEADDSRVAETRHQASLKLQIAALSELPAPRIAVCQNVDSPPALPPIQAHANGIAVIQREFVFCPAIRTKSWTPELGLGKATK